MEYILGVIEIQVFAQLLAYCTQRNTGSLPFFIADKEEEVILFCTQFRADFAFLSCKEFADAAFKCAVCINLHPCKTFCVVDFCNAFQSFNHLTAVFVRNIFDDQGFQSAALMAFNRFVCICRTSLECVKVAQICHKGCILHFKVKAQIRFVASVQVKCVIP